MTNFGNFQFSLGSNPAALIKVIGIGGAGGNAVNHMFQKGIKDVDFLVCNTDYQALDRNLVRNRLQLGPHLTEGRGAGNQPEIGRKAAVETVDEFKKLIGSETKMVFITAGLGGGTGTGAAPVLAEACRDMGILTVGIVTLPFGFEGKKRLEQAEIGLRELRQYCDTTLVISNDKVRELFGNLVFKEAFAKADDVLASAAKGIAEIITIDGYVNVDFADVKTVLHQSGKAVMGSGQASGGNRAIEAVRQAISSPLLNENDISGARNILINMSSGLEDPIRLDEIGEINDFVQTEAGANTDVIWGNCTDESLGEALRVTLIATGFEGQNCKDYLGERKVAVYPLHPDTAADSTLATPQKYPLDQPLAAEADPWELNAEDAREATRKVLEQEWQVGASNRVAQGSEEGTSLSSENAEPSWEPVPLTDFTVIDDEAFLEEAMPEEATPEATPAVRTTWQLFDATWTQDAEHNPAPASAPAPLQEETVEPVFAEEKQESFAPAAKTEEEVSDFFGYDGTVEWDLAVAAPAQPVPTPQDKAEEPSAVDVLTRSRQRIQSLRRLNSLAPVATGPDFEELEKVPAYVRAGYQPSPAQSSADLPLSRSTVGNSSPHSGQGMIRTDNRYLHDNVD